MQYQQPQQHQPIINITTVRHDQQQQQQMLTQVRPVHVCISPGHIGNSKKHSHPMPALCAAIRDAFRTPSPLHRPSRSSLLWPHPRRPAGACQVAIAEAGGELSIWSLSQCTACPGTLAGQVRQLQHACSQGDAGPARIPTRVTRRTP